MQLSIASIMVLEFHSWVDHSKWAVAETLPWTYIGDINRHVQGILFYEKLGDFLTKWHMYYNIAITIFYENGVEMVMVVSIYHLWLTLCQLANLDKSTHTDSNKGRGIEKIKFVIKMNLWFSQRENY